VCAATDSSEREKRKTEEGRGCGHGEERTGGLWAAAGGGDPPAAGGGEGGGAYGFRVGVRVRDLGLLGEGLHGRQP
jgi:hypothetical protein